MPVVSHFAAKPGAEADLFGLAYQLESAAPLAEKLPLCCPGDVKKNRGR
jgi:hypothetical protein